MKIRVAIVALLTAAACSSSNHNKLDLSADRLMSEISVLAADSLEGRRPDTPGEEKTIRYLVSQFDSLGLEPGNPDGGWTQPLTLVGITSVPTMMITTGGNSHELNWRTDFVAQSRREVDEIDVRNSDVVFVGYGVTAPEFGWDDYKDIDVAGKTIVMLVNDPPVRSVADTSALDPEMFRGSAMTYYGRWTYKYEEATRRGAAAALVIHQTGPAGYPWEVVQGGWTGERMDVTSADGKAGRLAVEGWLSSDAARELLASAGLDFDELQEQARHKEFRPVDLHAKASFVIKNTMRTVNTHNVIAKLPGSDPDVADEYVIYSAHWDHFGFGEPVNGDSIYNGARDNASGTAGLLELAHAFKADGAPRRSLLFLAVTAEEQGLLGSKWYAEHPLYALNKTLANINIDVLNAWGATRDITVVGMGNTTLEDDLAAEASARERTLSPDPEPEVGSFYRSDHFSFAKEGVPALYVEEGTDYIGKPTDYGMERRDDWTTNIYHKPSDEVDPAWDLSGAIADLELVFAVGRKVANADVWPSWKPGTEFKSIRETSLGIGN